MGSWLEQLDTSEEGCAAGTWGEVGGAGGFRSRGLGQMQGGAGGVNWSTTMAPCWSRASPQRGRFFSILS